VNILAMDRKIGTFISHFECPTKRGIFRTSAHFSVHQEMLFWRFGCTFPSNELHEIERNDGIVHD